MKLELEISEADLKKLIIAELAHTLGNVTVREEEIKIEVKSKQNYRAEWERAAFRATVNINR